MRATKTFQMSSLLFLALDLFLTGITQSLSAQESVPVFEAGTWQSCGNQELEAGWTCHG